MATRSTIAIQNPNGTVTGIYCHWDGYLGCNGVILQENYTTEVQVRDLIALGNLSSLGETLGNRVDFHDINSHAGQCVAYGRDRGETGVSCMTCYDWTDFLNDLGEEYNYLFVPSEGWRVEYSGNEGLLAQALAKQSSHA
jgi:hypothetical protein